MTPTLKSQSFNSGSVLPSDDTVREIVSQMPIVLLAKAIRDAFFGQPALKPSPIATRTFRTR